MAIECKEVAVQPLVAMVAELADVLPRIIESVISEAVAGGADRAEARRLALGVVAAHAPEPARVEPDRDRLIGIIARAIAVSDDDEWDHLHREDKEALAIAAMDVIDALAEAGMVVVLAPQAPVSPLAPLDGGVA